MRPAQYTAKMTAEATMTIPTPPRGKRMPSGAPSRTNTIQANAIEYFLCTSTRNWSADVLKSRNPGKVLAAGQRDLLS